MLDKAMTDKMVLCVDLNQAELAVRFIEAGEDGPGTGGRRPPGLSPGDCLDQLHDDELREMSLALAMVALEYFSEQMTKALAAVGGEGRLVPGGRPH